MRSGIERHHLALDVHELPLLPGEVALGAVEELLELAVPAGDAGHGQRGPLPEIVVVYLGDGGAEAIPELRLGRGDMLALSLQRAGLGEMQLDREDADVTGSVQVVAAAGVLSSRPVRSIARVS
jgi:hypothetical protein